MKNKAPLALMEQMVMLLVFALAAALCLQAFIKSDEISLRSQARSDAALAAQNVAEIARHSGGSAEYALMETAKKLGVSYQKIAGNISANLVIFYDKEWKPVTEEGDYILTVQEIPAAEAGLQKILIQVADLSNREDAVQMEALVDLPEEELLFELETAWLEEEAYE